MQFKTTAIMAVVLLVLVGWFLVERPDRQDVRLASAKPSTAATVGQRPVFEDPPESDAIVAVVATRAGETPWRFERADGDGEEADKGWKLVEPIESPVSKWDVDNIVRTVRELNYMISYKPDEAEGVTTQQAGLDPPRFAITLEDRSGGKITLDVGKPVSNSETYVRVGDGADILVAQRSLESLIKKNVNDYRDKSFVKFVSADARSIEIRYQPEDGEPVQYRLVKHGGVDWVFEEPFSADADDAAINAAIVSASRLRATEWVEVGERDGYHRLGLTMPLLDVEITTESKTQIKDDDDDDGDSDSDSDQADDADGEADEKEPQWRTETHRYGFQVSARSPIGKATAVYVKRADDAAVATVAKSIADKFIPVIEKWRDMDICPTPVTGAGRITITTAAGGPPATLIKTDHNDWVFKDTGAKAESRDVNDLLKTVDDLKALNFVDGADPADARFGLTQPSAEIVLTIPGRDQPERIAVGGATDPNSNLVFYLRRGESTSVAKVRAADARKLQRAPIEYLDRKIIGIAASDVTTIALTRPNAYTKQAETITLTQGDGGWRITQPVEAATETTAAIKLATTLADLNAEQVVTLSGSPAEYGLDNPSVGVTLVYTTPPTPPYQGGDSPDEDHSPGGDSPDEDHSPGGDSPDEDHSPGGDSPDEDHSPGGDSPDEDHSPGGDSPDEDHSPDADSPDEDTSPGGDSPDEDTSQPPAPVERTIVLQVAEKDGALFAKRVDTPTIYRLRRADYDTMRADVHDKKVLDFQQSQATFVSVTSGGVTHGFTKKDDGWVYASEPDLPIDAKKVTNLLLQLQDLKLKRYAAYGVGDLAGFGLDKPVKIVRVKTDEGRSITLLVSAMRSSGDTDGSVYAAIGGTQDVFVLTPDAVARFNISLDDFAKAADS